MRALRFLVAVCLMLGAGEAVAQDEGVCGSGLTTGDEGVDQCLGEICCGELGLCAANDSCNACLVGEGTSCNTNRLYQDWLVCSQTSCAGDVCGTRVTFFSNGSPAYKCNACASQCCACVSECVRSGSEDDIDFCLACLSDPDACPSPEVAAWARNFHACNNANCVDECGATDITGGDAASCREVSEGGASGDGGSSGGGGGAAASPATSTCTCTAPGSAASPPWLIALVGLAAFRRRVRPLGG